MRLDYVLWLYIIIVVVILLILVRNDKDFMNSLFFSLVIGLIFLIIVKPPNELNMENDNISCISIYFAIVFITFIIILIYSIITSFGNLDKPGYKLLASNSTATT